MKSIWIQVPAAIQCSALCDVTEKLILSSWLRFEDYCFLKVPLFREQLASAEFFFEGSNVVYCCWSHSGVEMILHSPFVQLEAVN